MKFIVDETPALTKPCLCPSTVVAMMFVLSAAPLLRDEGSDLMNPVLSVLPECTALYAIADPSLSMSTYCKSPTADP